MDLHCGVSSLDGGLYERMVGLVKRALRKSINRRLLSYVQLQTVIKEVVGSCKCTTSCVCRKGY